MMQQKKSNLTWYLVASMTVIMWLVAIILWISIPEEKTLNLSTTVCAIGLFICAILMRREQFKVFYKSSRFKAFSATLISAFLVAAILGLINYLAYKNPFQWDVTASKSNTLTEQSRNVLGSIPSNTKALIFASKNQQAPLQKILELYQLEKKDLIVETFDPELRPDLVQKYQLTKSLAVVWESGERRQIVYELNELGLTNGLIRLGRDKLPKIYYDTGHGESSLTSNEQNGRVVLRQYLENANFAIQEADTKRWQSVPEDADVLMIWGPKLSFMDNEVELFSRYLDKGGKLLIALDPNLNEDPVKNVRKMLNEHGIVTSNALVIDTLNNVSGSNGTIPIANSFANDHVITKEFPGQVFFPLTSFASIGAQAEGKELVFSTQFPAAWAEMSPQEFATGKVGYNEGVDIKGPVAYALVAKPKSGGTVAYFGNSSFIDNAYAKYASNQILLLNTLSWLTGDDQLISFDLAGVDNSQPVFISSPQLGVIFFFSVILAPLTLFALAIWNYRRRRIR